MSLETFIVGDIELNDEGKKNENTKKVLEMLKEDLELRDEDIKYEAGIDVYSFSSVNWCSHVDYEQIKEAYRRIMKYADYFSASLWFLTSPDAVIFKNSDDIKEDIEENVKGD